MTNNPNPCTLASSEPTSIRPLAAHELGLVAGGPMGFPGLGQKPGPQGNEPRLLTASELTLVAGGPAGYPGLALPPDTEIGGSPVR